MGDTKADSLGYLGALCALVVMPVGIVAFHYTRHHLTPDWHQWEWWAMAGFLVLDTALLMRAWRRR